MGFSLSSGYPAVSHGSLYTKSFPSNIFFEISKEMIQTANPAANSIIAEVPVLERRNCPMLSNSRICFITSTAKGYR